MKPIKLKAAKRCGQVVGLLLRDRCPNTAGYAVRVHHTNGTILKPLCDRCLKLRLKNGVRIGRPPLRRPIA